MSVEGDHAAAADTIQYSKRMLAHSYMSSSVDMSAIVKDFDSVPVDAFVIRAAAKAYRSAVASEGELNVNRMVKHGSHVTYTGVQDLRVGQISASGVENGAVPGDQPLI